MITFGGTIDRKMFARALRRQMRGLQFIAVIWVLVGSWGLTSAVVDRPVTWGWPLFLLLLGALFLFLPSWSARTSLKTGQLISAPFTGSADESRFALESPYGRSEVTWPAFNRSAVYDDSVLLFTSAQQFFLVSREFFETEEQWNAFRALVARSVPVRSRRTSPMKAALIWIAIIVLVFLLRALSGP